MNEHRPRPHATAASLVAAACFPVLAFTSPVAFRTAEAALSVPSSTVTILRSEKGATWSQVREGGMSLDFRGEGGFYLSVVSLSVKDGRVVNRWSAPSRLRASQGTITLPGERFLPGDEFPPGDQFYSGDKLLPRDRTISASDARRAIESHDATVFFDPRYASRVTGLLVIALPLCSSSDQACQASGTNPLFMAVEPLLN